MEIQGKSCEEASQVPQYPNNATKAPFSFLANRQRLSLGRSPFHAIFSPWSEFIYFTVNFSFPMFTIISDFCLHLRAVEKIEKGETHQRRELNFRFLN